MAKHKATTPEDHETPNVTDATGPAQNEMQPEHMAPTEPAEREPEVIVGGVKKKFGFKAFWHTKKGKVVCILLPLAIIIGVVFAVPISRYAVAGLVIKKDLQVLVTDSSTGKPVSAATVGAANQTVKTDANGKATLRNVPVGQWQVSIKKTYYKDTAGSTLVPILSNQSELRLNMEATGRQVPVKTINKLTGAALGGVEITAGDASVTTAEDGSATLVLPADQTVVGATFKLDGFNTATGEVTVTEQTDDKNTFSLTASGKVYFLSKRTGKINVMKSDLDGANASVVLEATGKEDESQTVLLASRDWKYLALQSKRESKDAKIYLIITADDTLRVIDEGDDATFSPIGWSNEHFIYKVTRNNVQAWQPKQQSIKSYNATNGTITTLEDTDGLGSGPFDWAGEAFTNVYIIGDRIVYAKYWNNYYGTPALVNGKKDAVYQIQSNGQGKKAVKEFDSTTSSYLEATLYRPDEVYFRASGTPNKYYEYHDGTVTETSEINDTNFYNQTYITYLISPTGKQAFWYEARDGKNVLFVGDAQGANGKEIMSSDSYKPYGWFTDDYLLLAKNSSELYVLPRNVAGAQPIKVTDYHKPSVSFPGYGYGYGGAD